MSNEPDGWSIPRPSAPTPIPTPSDDSIQPGDTQSSSVLSNVKAEPGTYTGGHSSSFSSAGCPACINAHSSYFNLSIPMIPTKVKSSVNKAFTSGNAGQPPLTLTSVPKLTPCPLVPSPSQSMVGSSKSIPVPASAQALITNVTMAQNKGAGPKLLICAPPTPASNVPGGGPLIVRNGQGSDTRSTCKSGVTDSSNPSPIQLPQNANVPIKDTAASSPFPTVFGKIPTRTSLPDAKDQEPRAVQPVVASIAGGTSSTTSATGPARLIDPSKSSINETVDQSEINRVPNQAHLAKGPPSAPPSNMNIVADVNTRKTSIPVDKPIIKKLPTRIPSSHTTSSSSKNSNLKPESIQEDNVQKPTSLTKRAIILPDDTSPIPANPSVPIADGRTSASASLVVEAKRSSVVSTNAPSAPSPPQAPPLTAPPSAPAATASEVHKETSTERQRRQCEVVPCAMPHPPPFVQYVPYEVHYLEMDQEDSGIVRRVCEVVGEESKEESTSLPAGSGAEGNVNTDTPGSKSLRIPFVLNASKQNPVDDSEGVGARGGEDSSASPHCSTCQCQFQAAAAPSLSSTKSIETQTSNDSDSKLSMTQDGYQCQLPDEKPNCGKRSDLVPSWLYLPSVSTIVKFLLTWIAHFVLLVCAFLFVDEYRGNGTTRAIMRDSVLPSIGAVGPLLRYFDQGQRQPLMLGAGTRM